MNARFAILVSSVIALVACGGASEDVVLAEGSGACTITRGLDVCTYFATTKPAVREDLALTLQRTSTLADQAHDRFERTATACENIATDLGNGKPRVVTTEASLRDSCERASKALRAAMAGRQIKVTFTSAGSCPDATIVNPTTCSEARVPIVTCSSQTIEVTGVSTEEDLRIEKTIETNVLSLSHVALSAPKLVNGLTEVVSLPQNPEGLSTRETSCILQRGPLLTSSAAELSSATSGATAVLSVLSAP